MQTVLPAPSVDFAALLALPGQSRTVARTSARDGAAQLIGQSRALPTQAPKGGSMASMLACRTSGKPKKRR